MNRKMFENYEDFHVKYNEPYPFDDIPDEVNFKFYCQYVVNEGGHWEYGSYIHYLDDAENPYDPTEAHYSLEEVAKHIDYKLKKIDYTSFFNNFKREVKMYVNYEPDGYWVVIEKYYPQYFDAIGNAIYYTLKDKVSKERKFYLT